MKKARQLLLPIAILAFACLLMPSAAQAFKPKIVTAYATRESGQVTFTARIRMDKRSRRNRKVEFTYKGDTTDGTSLKNFPNYWESGKYNAPAKKCYSVTITASNRSGTTTRHVRAGRINSDGCRL